MISAILLASGFSSRMNTNKLLLQYGSKTLIEHTIDTILKCGFSQVVLVARDQEILKLGYNYGLKVIENKNANKGMSESIKLGLTYAQESDGYMFFTVDQPFLDMDTIKRSVTYFERYPLNIIVPHFKGRRGSPVIFPKKFKQVLLNLEGDTGGRSIINQYMEQAHYVEVDDEKRLFDIDTLDDYEKALEWDGAKNEK